MEDKLELFYVRHGETDNSLIEDRDTCDVNLTAKGEKQAELLGESLKGKKFDAVFSSPLVRAVRTAAAVCKNLENHPEIELLPQIIENGSSYGYFGETTDYLSKYYDRFKVNNDLPLFYDNLSDEDNDKRAKAVIEYFRKRFTYGQKIIVFAHGSFGTHFITQAVDMSSENIIFSLNHTSVSKIKYTPDGKQRISYTNNVDHLKPIFENYLFDI